MTATEYHQLIMAAQTIALCVLAVALMFLGFVLWHVATALRRLQATRLAVVQIEAVDRRGVAAPEAAASGVVPLRSHRQRVMGGYPPSTPPPGDRPRSQPQPPRVIPPRQR